MDEYGMGSSMMNSGYGYSHNPIDENVAISPGGSSGGSAVAVASSLCHGLLEIIFIWQDFIFTQDQLDRTPEDLFASQLPSAE